MSDLFSRMGTVAVDLARPRVGGLESLSGSPRVDPAERRDDGGLDLGLRAAPEPGRLGPNDPNDHTRPAEPTAPAEHTAPEDDPGSAESTGPPVVRLSARPPAPVAPAATRPQVGAESGSGSRATAQPAQPADRADAAARAETHAAAELTPIEPRAAGDPAVPAPIATIDEPDRIETAPIRLAPDRPRLAHRPGDPDDMASPAPVPGQPVVQIHIGRLDVRAAPAAARPRPASTKDQGATRPAELSLADYLAGARPR